MKVKHVLIGSLVFMGGYVVAALVNQAKLASDTSIEYAGYQVIGISASRVRVRLDLRVQNKSALGFSIFNQAYEVFVNNQKVADVSEWNKAYVPAKGSSVVSLLVEFNPKEAIPTLWQQLITNLGSATVRLKGKISVRTGILFGRIPVDETFVLKNFKVQ